MIESHFPDLLIRLSDHPNKYQQMNLEGKKARKKKHGKKKSNEKNEEPEGLNDERGGIKANIEVYYEKIISE